MRLANGSKLDFMQGLSFKKQKAFCEKHGEFEAIVIIGRNRKPECPKCLKEREAEYEFKQQMLFFENVLHIPKMHQLNNFLNFRTENEVQKKALKIIKDLAMENKNKNVLLYGKSGTGKSHLLVASVKAFRGERLYTTWERIDLCIRATYSQASRYTECELLKHLIELDFLAIDEIEKGADTENKRAKLSFIFRERYENLRPTYLAGNCNERWIKEFLDESVLDRFVENGISFNFNWKSYRVFKKQIKDEPSTSINVI